MSVADTLASPELTGGTGFTFEDACVAVYMVALLAEETAAGLPERTVVGVAVQQAPTGRPLDDLVITAKAADGSQATLDLQIKRALILSAAASKHDFRSVVTRAWQTIATPTFHEDMDRVGAVTGQIASDSKRALETVCEWARSHATAASFLQSFSAGIANDTHRAIRDAVRIILAEIDPALGDDALHRFFRHFVLVTFDFLHDGATTPPTQTPVLRTVLADSDKSRAEDLWQRLQRVAREAAGRGANFDRATLLNRLHGAFRFAGGRSLQADLAILQESAIRALAEIENTIDGLSLPRPTTSTAIAAASATHRYVQVTGLLGTGKSAALRAFAETYAAQGPVLVLKADRLEGSTWATYAAGLGVDPRLKPLLQEIAAIGTPILFIDGLDRIEIANRGIVNDLLNAFASDPDLGQWRVVASVRDNGIEPLRTWLSPAWARTGASIVEVPSFDDDEAEEIATQRPALRALLFGDAKLQELARRPFFLSALAGLPGAQSIHSEINLIDAWWQRGGYNAPGARAGHHQRALLALARSGALTMGRRIAITDIDPTSIAELRADGIIRDIRVGHTVAFTHDIYFEWAFLHLLIEAGTEWPATLRAVGEPPVLGRVVELLSQSVLLAAEDWAGHLHTLETSTLRPQWRRAWLLGPFNLPTFATFADTFSTAVLADGAQRLRHVAVWFQAEKTRANPQVLDGALGVKGSTRELIRMADLIAWPSDLALWLRFLDWVLALDSRLPHTAVPDIVSAFEVWQNLFADRPNRVSDLILTRVEGWLFDLEDRLHPDQFRYDHGPWPGSSDALRELEARLRTLLLRAGRAYPARVKTYLDRMDRRKRLRSVAFEDIVGFAPVLVGKHSEQLVAITLAETLDDLPSVKLARERGREGWSYSGINHHDWSHLSIRVNPRPFHPPAPTREPFASLFAKAPDNARALVRGIVNHAVAAWRDLHTLDPEREGTPVPIILDFPWGQQTFWGNQNVYGWYRGLLAPAPVDCALMALERWAFAELERGQPVDAVIRAVVEDQNSCAVLGIAIALALTAQEITPGILPLVTSQRLWRYDIHRLIQDATMQANLMGFSAREMDNHYDAVKTGNSRPCRRDEIRSAAILCVLSGDETLREAARAAIADFPNHLPFDLEEQQNIPEFVAELRRNAEIWAQLANPDTYKLYRARDGDQVYVKHESPQANDPDVVEVVECQRTMADRSDLTMWATKTFETGAIDPRLTIADAVVRARALDAQDLFAEGTQDFGNEDLRRNAVAGVAAVVLAFGDQRETDTFAWVRDAVARAAKHVGAGDHFFSGSMLAFHPCLFAAQAFAAEIKRGGDVRTAKQSLLALAAHPYDQVAEAALAGAMGCWNTDPQFAWAALNLGLALSIGSWGAGPRSPYGYDQVANTARAQKAVAAAIAASLAAEPVLTTVTVPPAWTKAEMGEEEPRRRGKRGWRTSDEFLRWDFLPRVIRHVPVDLLMADPLRAPVFFALCGELVRWTAERINPPWLGEDEQARDDRSTEVLEWRDHLFRFLAKVAFHVPVNDTATTLLAPAFALNGDGALSLIRPFVDIVACAGIYDPAVVAPQAVPLMELCLDRVLAMDDWKRASWNDGRIHGFDMPEVVRVFLFVQVDKASGAARFANGDWKDVGLILPLIDKFVKAVGQVPNVMSTFLTLCERGIEHYPVQAFVEQCEVVLAKDAGTPLGWRGTTLPGWLAALIYEFAEHARPLDQGLAQRMLRILDRLVDMGDRRSAALQTSELFKEVRSV